MTAGAALMAESKKGESARLAADVIQMARIIASQEDLHIADLLADILRPILRKRLQENYDKGLGLPDYKPKPRR